jgi:hypothetical protein
MVPANVKTHAILKLKVPVQSGTQLQAERNGHKLWYEAILVVT